MRGQTPRHAGYVDAEECEECELTAADWRRAAVFSQPTTLMHKDLMQT